MKQTNPNVDEFRKEWMRHREFLGLSQGEAAELIGENQQNVSRFERGARPQAGTWKYRAQIVRWREEHGDLIQCNEEPGDYTAEARELMAKRMDLLSDVLRNPSFDDTAALHEFENAITRIYDDLPGFGETLIKKANSG